MSAETRTRFFHVRSMAVGGLSSPREGRPASLDSRFATLGGHGALALAWNNVEKNKTQRVQVAVGSWPVKGVKGLLSTASRFTPGVRMANTQCDVWFGGRGVTIALSEIHAGGTHRLR